MISKSLRRHVLEEWRGLPDRARPERLTDSASAIQDLVKRLGLSERIDEAEIAAEWKAIVGDFLAEHSKPARLQQGILVIQVVQPTIRFELERTWKKQIIAKLKERFGTSTIRDVKFYT